jgi:hypothetical protein
MLQSESNFAKVFAKADLTKIAKLFTVLRPAQ